MNITDNNVDVNGASISEVRTIFDDNKNEVCEERMKTVMESDPTFVCESNDCVFSQHDIDKTIPEATVFLANKMSPVPCKNCAIMLEKATQKVNFSEKTVVHSYSYIPPEHPTVDVPDGQILSLSPNSPEPKIILTSHFDALNSPLFHHVTHSLDYSDTSRDNPFQPDGKLSHDAERIIRASTITRDKVEIHDPELERKSEQEDNENMPEEVMTGTVATSECAESNGKLGDAYSTGKTESVDGVKKEISKENVPVVESMKKENADKNLHNKSRSKKIKDKSVNKGKGCKCVVM